MEKLKFINCTSPNCGKRFLQLDKNTTCPECTPDIRIDNEVKGIIDKLVRDECYLKCG